MSSVDTEKAPLIDSPPAYFPPETLETLDEQLQTARQNWLEANNAYFTAWRQTPSGRRLTRINNFILGLVAIIGSCMVGGMLLLLGYAMFIDDPSSLAPRLVPLEAHIMSKCPDANDCLRELVLPAMQEVAPYVDFRLSYIGSVSNGDDGVTCPHGPGECLGNIVELCAQTMYVSEPKIYLGFTMCLSREYEQIPSEDLVRACALEHGIRFSDLNECASLDDGSMGMNVLRESVERSASANVTKSCTVRVDDKVWCVRDDGNWVGCEDGHETTDLVKTIMGLRNKHEC